MKVNQKINTLLFIMLALTLTTSCQRGEFRRTMGISQTAPDEFAVLPSKKLTIPSSYTLPEPGTPVANSINSVGYNSAEQIILGENASASKPNTASAPSALEIQIAEQNIGVTDSRIRQKIKNEEQEQTGVFGVEKGSTLEAIVDPFGANTPKPQTIDGAAENARIRKALSQGKALTGEVEVTGNN